MDPKTRAFSEGELFVADCNDLAARGENVFRDPKFAGITQDLYRLLAEAGKIPGVDPARNTDSVFYRLQAAIRDGTAEKQFPVGTILPDTWYDVNTGQTYSMPHRIVHYGTVQLPEFKEAYGATLLRVNALPHKIVFSKYNLNSYGNSDCQYFLNYGDYCAGCSQDLLDAVATSVLRTWFALNDYYVRAKFFLPAAPDLHYDTDKKDEIWEYFRDGLDPRWGGEKRVFRTPDGTPAECWTRSLPPSRKNPGSWTISLCCTTPGGYMDIVEAREERHCVPACNIIGL